MILVSELLEKVPVRVRVAVLLYAMELWKPRVNQSLHDLLDDFLSLGWRCFSLFTFFNF